MKRKIIIAGTYEEYVRCCHQNCVRVGEVPWITKARQIEELTYAVEPIFFGVSYSERGEYLEIIRALKSKGIIVKGQRIKIT